jgi:hypothetical protein
VSNYSFTRIELVLSLLLAVILLTLLPAARKAGGAPDAHVRCLDNLRQLGMGFHAYADDNGDFLPLLTNWGGGMGPWWSKAYGARYGFRAAEEPEASPLLNCPLRDDAEVRSGRGAGYGKILFEYTVNKNFEAGYADRRRFRPGTGQKIMIGHCLEMRDAIDRSNQAWFGHPAGSTTFAALDGHAGTAGRDLVMQEKLWGSYGRR